MMKCAISWALTWLFYTVSGSTEFNATCQDDNTIRIQIPFDKTAEVLALNYGVCNKDSAGVTNIAQNADFSFNITLSLAECGADTTLRALEYSQVAIIRIGRTSVDISTGASRELALATFSLDSFCSIKDTYEVTFGYTNISLVTDFFNDTSGTTQVQFSINAYDVNYTTVDFAYSTLARERIYLGLTVSTVSFNHNEREFAPQKCVIRDVQLGFEYTLFDATTTGGCINLDVDFVIGYDSDTKMWRMSHILFLLGDVDESTLLLTCTVKVCDIDSDSVCDTMRTECGVEQVTVDGPCVPNAAWASDAHYVQDWADLGYVDAVYKGDDYALGNMNCASAVKALSASMAYFGIDDMCSYLSFDYYYVDNTHGSWRDNCCPELYTETSNCGFT